MFPPTHSIPSHPLKLSNKGMDFPFPQLKLSNKGMEEYSKMILFIPFHSIPSFQMDPETLVLYGNSSLAWKWQDSIQWGQQEAYPQGHFGWETLSWAWDCLPLWIGVSLGAFWSIPRCGYCRNREISRKRAQLKAFGGCFLRVWASVRLREQILREAHMSSWGS